MLIASILAEIFQTVKTSISLLYLVYKNKCLSRSNRLLSKSLERLHNTIHMKILLKKGLHAFIVMTIHIYQIIKLILPKLF